MIPSMPSSETLYRLAKMAKDRAQSLDRPIGPNSMADHLNHIGNRYLVALTMAEREAQNG